MIRLPLALFAVSVSCAPSAAPDSSETSASQVVDGTEVIGPATEFESTVLEPYVGNLPIQAAMPNGEQQVVFANGLHFAGPDGVPLEPFGRDFPAAFRAIDVTGAHFAAVAVDAAGDVLLNVFDTDAVPQIPPVVLHRAFSTMFPPTADVAVAGGFIWATFNDRISPGASRLQRYALDGTPAGPSFNSIGEVNLLAAGGMMYAQSGASVRRFSVSGTALDLGFVAIAPASPPAARVELDGDDRGLTLSWCTRNGAPIPGAAVVHFVSHSLVQQGVPNQVALGCQAWATATTTAGARMFVRDAANWRVLDIGRDGTVSAPTAFPYDVSEVYQRGDETFVFSQGFTGPARITRLDANRNIVASHILRMQVRSEGSPSLARNGAAALALWQRDLSAQYVRLALDGALLSSRIIEPFAPWSRVTPADGDGFWMLGSTTQLSPRTSAGDAAGAPINASAIARTVRAVDAAVSAGRTLFASADDTGVRVRRLANGVPLDAGETPLWSFRSTLQVVAGPAGWLVLGLADGAALFARVDVDGDVLDLPVQTFACLCSHLTGVYAGGRYHLAWNTAQPDGVRRLYSRTVELGGQLGPIVERAVFPPDGEVAELSMVADGADVLALVTRHSPSPEGTAVDVITRWRGDGAPIWGRIETSLGEQATELLTIEPGRFLLVTTRSATIGRTTHSRNDRRILQLTAPGGACREAVTCASGYCDGTQCCATACAPPIDAGVDAEVDAMEPDVDAMEPDVDAMEPGVDATGAPVDAVPRPDATAIPDDDSGGCCSTGRDGPTAIASAMILMGLLGWRRRRHQPRRAHMPRPR